MRHTTHRTLLALAGGVLITGAALGAHGRGLQFSDFTPLAASSGPAVDEAFPVLLSNDDFAQRSIADRASVLAEGIPHMKFGKRRVRFDPIEVLAWCKERFGTRRIGPLRAAPTTHGHG